jgi:hypothetical protein
MMFLKGGDNKERGEQKVVVVGETRKEERKKERRKNR